MKGFAWLTKPRMIALLGVAILFCILALHRIPASIAADPLHEALYLNFEKLFWVILGLLGCNLAYVIVFWEEEK